MKQRNLFICNSIYQILVTLWIKYTDCERIPSDIIISDHMNNAEALSKKIIECKMFENVYYVKSEDYAKFRIKTSRLEKIEASIVPNFYLRRYVKLNKNYTNLYVANVDYFSQLIFDALSHRNPNVGLSIYEDGMFTYSRLYELDYLGTAISVNGSIKRFIHKYIYRKRTILGNVSDIQVFNPENMLWIPPFDVKKIKKINCEDEQFKSICNNVFSYENDVDKYDTKYIFMEESFSAEGCELNDLEVLNKLAERVGKENIMVKIHPRNPVNRFAKQGYRTNVNTSIPWEVILMNIQDISEKVLITISSSSVLNPILIFDKKVKVYSIYECVDHENCNSRLLSGEMWEMAHSLFLKYNDMVKICNSVDEIE